MNVVQGDDSRRNSRSGGLGLCAVVLLAFGCTKTLAPPNLGGLYNRAASHHDAMRNPVIVIPGILGSKLFDEPTGRAAWGAFAGGYANPETTSGARIVALPMEEGRTLGELRDGIVPQGVLDRASISLIGLPIELSAYVHILATLGVGGYRDEPLGEAGIVDYGDDHYTCFQFDYDWRRDNVENARRLHRFILQKKAYVQEEYKRRYGIDRAEIKFDIIAHSMGGLVSRYYLRYGDQDMPVDGSAPQLNWAGAEYVDRLIMIGTPNGGSVKSLIQLVHGVRFAPILPKYNAVLLGTMPSIYQLLPRNASGAVRLTGINGPIVEDLYDIELWKRMGWGLASPRADRTLATVLPSVAEVGARRRIALDHLAKCLDRARQFNAALDVPATAPEGTTLYLFAGDAVATDSVVAINRRNGAVRTVEQTPGDGTVTRASALGDLRVPDEWQPGLLSPIDFRHVTFLFTDHLGLTSDPAFADNVLFILLERPVTVRSSRSGARP